ncbi:hypothetical protein ACH4UM_04000 [Streptomyces sp. NPDC020801]|uniref:hypothetical protein n=1 Tax=unclassified Streptomyces TaxID=2593676 RepID=UPI0037BDCC05
MRPAPPADRAHARSSRPGGEAAGGEQAGGRADAARTAPVLLLATARDGDSAWRDRAWARAQLLRRGRTLPLGPLREEDIAALVQLLRADLRDGALSEVSVYCTGDWSPATQAARLREVRLLRP